MFDKLKHKIITFLGGTVPAQVPDKTDFRVTIGQKISWVNLSDADVIGASWQNREGSRFIYIFKDGDIHIHDFSEQDRPNVVTSWEELINLRGVKP